MRRCHPLPQHGNQVALNSDTKTQQLNQPRLLEWQFANPFSGSRKHGVADRRRNRRNARLADPRRRFVARDDMNVRDVRRFRHPRNGIIVEIRLPNLAVGRRDFTHQRDAGPEHRSALKLRLYAIGIDNHAGIDRHIDAVQMDLTALIDLQVHNRRHISVKAPVGGDAKRPAFRSFLVRQPERSAATSMTRRSRAVSRGNLSTLSPAAMACGPSGLIFLLLGSPSRSSRYSTRSRLAAAASSSTN